MLNIITAECMKLKRDRLLILCSAIAILLPIMLLGGTTVWTVASTVFKLQGLCQLSVYPILSGFVITFLFQKEYADLTIINTLTAPVSRIKFLFGKLVVWGAWHIIITLCFLIISCICVYTFYGEQLFFENLSAIIKVVLKAGILNLASMLPVVWIAVLQKKAFYPSLLFTFIITVTGFSGMMQPGLIGNLIPWIAVILLVIPGGEVLYGTAYASIVLCAVVGLGLALYSVKKQEL